MISFRFEHVCVESFGLHVPDTLLSSAEIEQRIAPAYERLTRYIPVTFLNFAPKPVKLDPPDLKYWMMTELHKFMISYAKLKDAGIVMLTPDSLMADGALQRLAQSIDNGKRVFMTHAPMLERDGFMPEVEAWLDRHGEREAYRDGVIAIPPRPLMAMAARHYHPMTECYFIGSKRFNHFTSWIYWPLGEQGLLARVAHMGPVFFYPERWDASLFDENFRTIDQTFIAEACPDLSTYDVCTDSDEFLYVEIGPSEKTYPVRQLSYANPLDFGIFAWKHLNAFNLAFFQQKLWLHAGIDRAEWAEVERASDRWVARAMDKVELVREAAPAPS